MIELLQRVVQSTVQQCSTSIVQTVLVVVVRSLVCIVQYVVVCAVGSMFGMFGFLQCVHFPTPTGSDKVDVWMGASI